jgi:act minimal PKS chain-length factor (CLF/KS beta)
MRSAAVVTGIGVMAPNGSGGDQFWKATLEGRSGLRETTGPARGETRRRKS